LAVISLGYARTRHFISFLYCPFIQPKNVEIVVMCCAMRLLIYRCQMTEYNYNTMITP